MNAVPYGVALAAYPEGQRLLARDWSQHPLGPVEQWDESLLAGLSFILPMSLPAVILWESSARLFFNAAFEKAFPDRSLVQGQAVGDTADPLWKSLISYRTDATEVSILVNGMPEWWQFVQSPLGTRSGDIRGRIVLLVDINARKLSEQALNASEETLLSLMDQQPKFLWRSDPFGAPVWINRLGRQFLGLADGEMLDGARSILAPDLAVMLAELQQGVKLRQAVELQVRIRSAQKGVRCCLMYFVPMMDARGRVHAWSGSGADIHEWHEAAMRASHRLSPLPEGDHQRPVFDRYGRKQLSFVVEVETGRMRPLNARSGVEWGISPEGPPELFADWLMRLRPEQRERADDTLAMAAEGTVAEDVWTVTLQDGSERHAHVTVFPITGEDGAVRQIGGILKPTRQMPEQRVYFVDLDPPPKKSRCEIQRALVLLGIKVRRFDSLETFAVVHSDLKQGALVIRSSRPHEDLRGALEMLHEIRDRFPWVLLANAVMEMGEVVEIMNHGAQTVLPPQAKRAEAVAAVRSAIPVDALLSERAVEEFDRLDSLSVRERQVLDGLLGGGTNKTIAAALGLSPRTVETHRAHLMDRLGAKSLADLIRIVGPHYMANHTRRTG
ncbi:MULTISPECIES: LuxR C-terminal-related transcriptional regulator [unclassified Brevundimonas]|uniref:LuxR C-terminal-related transcriptional regulator n=1 Tax=unclassified Brevundimonas TaxID=2622653 RepID=UPI0025B9D750|nr:MULTISPECIES: LuxR C-terminal-related transcriptional regulator [unclassified Brevundimonas]